MKQFAQKHPVLTFLLINFAWTWLFWLAAIPFRAQNDLLVMAIVMIGGFGPALGGILTLGLRSGARPDFSAKRIAVMITRRRAHFHADGAALPRREHPRLRHAGRKPFAQRSDRGRGALRQPGGRLGHFERRLSQR